MGTLVVMCDTPQPPAILRVIRAHPDSLPASELSRQLAYPLVVDVPACLAFNLPHEPTRELPASRALLGAAALAGIDALIFDYSAPLLTAVDMGILAATVFNPEYWAHRAADTVED